MANPLEHLCQLIQASMVLGKPLQYYANPVTINQLRMQGIPETALACLVSSWSVPVGQVYGIPPAPPLLTTPTPMAILPIATKPRPPHPSWLPQPLPKPPALLMPPNPFAAITDVIRIGDDHWEGRDANGQLVAELTDAGADDVVRANHI